MDTCLKHLEELADTYFAEEISLLCTMPSVKKFLQIKKIVVSLQQKKETVFNYFRDEEGY